MSSDSMLIHAGARQLEEHLLRRPRLARTPCPFVHVMRDGGDLWRPDPSSCPMTWRSAMRGTWVGRRFPPHVVGFWRLYGAAGVPVSFSSEFASWWLVGRSSQIWWPLWQ
jgi:hypothetical protein